MKQRIIAGVLALCLSINLMPATAFAEEDTNCIFAEGCLVEGHENGCPTEKVKCTGTEGCLVEGHENGCPTEEVGCTGTEGCLVEGHENGCPTEEVECTGTEGCLVEGHENGCPTEEVKCTGTEGCLVEGHENGCPTEEVECTGTEGCLVEGHENGCPTEEVECTGTEGCLAEVHENGCPLKEIIEEQETIKSSYRVKKSNSTNYDVSVSNNYYNIMSDKTYVLCDGVIEKEIVINNSDATRRQILHVMEVDTDNSNVEILPSYYQIDKDLTDSKNWSAQIMDKQMDYYRDNLGYNVVGGMNTALAYDSDAPSSFLVWNGQVLATPALHGNSQTYLAVTKNDNGTVECELRPTTEALHGNEWQAVSCNFGFVVSDGKLNSTKVSRSDAADRSMIGIKEDGTLVVCQAEGRNAPYAVGLSSYELGETMLALGCKWAVNGDGGGSSQFLTKREGEADYSLRNIPSDGTPRATINGIIIASKAKPSGVFDHVSMIAEHQYITPGSTVSVEISGVDSSGAPAEIPTDGLAYVATGGKFENGVFISDGTLGVQSVTAYYADSEVGTIAIEVVVPTKLEFVSSEMVIPYGKEDVDLGLIAYYGNFEIPLTTNDVKIVLDNNTIGKVDGLGFTSVTEGTELESISSKITATLNYNENVIAEARITLGRGSEIKYDFEDQSLHGFYRYTSLNYNYNNPAGETKIVDSAKGKVRNGDYAMAVELDFSNSLEAGYQLGSLMIGEEILLENATRIGMWIYVPDEAAGIRIDSGLPGFGGNWEVSNAGNATVTELGFANGFEESGWHYISKDISSADQLKLSKDSQFLKFYISQKDGKNDYSYGDQSSVNGKYTFYIDDITVDYSSAVDDREEPIFKGISYAISGMDESVTIEKDTAVGYKVVTVSENTVSFIASVEENTTKNNYTGIDVTSGKAYVDGVDYTSALVWTGNTKMSLNDLTLSKGRHVIKFSVCDRQGNYSSIIREIVVGSTDDSSIKVVAHNPEANRILLGSLYYVDIVANDISNVSRVNTILDLNNISVWELEHMDVADGFEAEYTLVNDENIAEITITRTGKNNQAGEQILVSIPIRTWQLAPTVAIYGHAGKVWMYPNYKAGNEILPMDLSIETDAGYVTYVDGTKESFTSPRIQVYTEMSGNAYTSSGSAANNYIRNESWYAEWNGGHDHRTETAQYYAEGATNVVTPVKLQDKAATCTEEGYKERTYCEVCDSIVEWGTTIPKTDHQYFIKDGTYVCECGDTYVSSDTNGLVEIEGKLYYFINGLLKTGWIVDGTDYYYFDPSTYAAVDGMQTLDDGYTYLFENNVLVKGDFVTDANGSRYRWAGKWLTLQWFEQEGNKYFANSNGYAVTGIFKINNASGLYVFDDNGVWLESQNGLYHYNDEMYLTKDGIIVEYPGLVKIGDSYYYFRSSNIAVKGRTYWITKTNGLLPEQSYEFDSDGRLIIEPIEETKDGLCEENGELYYYEDGIKVYAGLVKIGNDYYYINSACKAIRNRAYWISKTNGLLPEQSYEFDVDGKIIMEPAEETKNGLCEESGELFYYENGIKVYAGLVKIGNDYYYINSACKAIRNRAYWISKTNGLLPEQSYEFDVDGKIIMEPVEETKNGLCEEAGELYYYEDGIKTYAGLIKIENDYYYINSACKAIRNRVYWISKTNGLLPEQSYTFDANGKIIL